MRSDTKTKLLAGIAKARACERPDHYRDRAALLRFDAQLEQRHASENGGLPKVVTDELAILDRADLLVVQYPMWWHLPPQC
jgi:NAD(P)H dehydrogenase (quinone)